MNHKHLDRYLCVGAAVAAGVALSGCDSGSAGGGGASDTGGSTGSGNTTSSTHPTGSTSGNTTTSGTATAPANAIVCTSNYCTIGMGGYAFGYSDSDPPSGMGTSKATLASNGSLCISGNVMALPPNPTAADYTNDWGCGIGVNVNQAMGMNTPKGTFKLTGTGVTVSVANLPSCTTARVVLDDMDGTVAYCAPLASGTEIPWASFNTECWNGMGTALSGPPTSQAIKIQFVTGMTECDFSNFCLTEVMP